MDDASFTVSIPHKEIEAIVSNVDLKEYGSKALAKKAKEDVKWIIKHAQKHEKVIEHAMKNRGKIAPIIPMKFGTIFEKPQGLENILKKDYQKFRKTLKNLDGKQEWSVKVYVKESPLQEKLKSSEKKIKARVKQAKELPRGADYFGELEVEKELGGLMQKKIGELVNAFFKALGAIAFEADKNKVLSQELRGRKEPMVLNSAYLIAGAKVRDFIEKVKELQKSNPEFIFEHTGPWPPYNFVK